MGRQTPTHRLVPHFDYSRGDEAIDLAELAGITFDPWQKTLLRDGLGVIAVRDEDDDTGDAIPEAWAAFEVGVELSRQNGKSRVFEARALAGLYLFREKLIVYTAHKGETAMEAFHNIEELIAGTPELAAEVRKVSSTNGKESITLKSGQRIKFRTRTTGGGRGLSGVCVLLDEAQDLDDDEHAALLPTMSAQPNPQLWYAGSAGTQASTVLGRLVRRCNDAEPDLVMHRWAASEDDDPDKHITWAKTNPSVGRRMTIAHIAKEHRSMAAGKFARERLGIGDYPREEGEDWVIPAARWEHCKDAKSAPVGPVVISADSKPDQEWASIGIAGFRKGGRHIEVTDHQRGTRWVGARLVQLASEHDNLGVVIDPKGPLAFLIPELVDLGLTVHTMTAQDMIDACSWLYNAAVGDPPQVFHRGSPVLTSALASAATRKLLDRWAWRRQGAADISPLVAVTIAAHGLTMLGKPKPPPATPRRAASAGRGRRTSETADLSTASF